MAICKVMKDEYVLDPAYRASGLSYGNYSSPGQHFEIQEYERKYFWERNSKNKLKSDELDRLPRPGMYNGKPCFYGGLTPPSKTEDFDMLEWIVNLQLTYQLVDFCKIRAATDAEFKRFFEPFYENHRVKIVNCQFYLDNKPLYRGVKIDESYTN